MWELTWKATPFDFNQLVEKFMGESVFVRGPGEKGDLAEDNEEVLRSQLYIGKLHRYMYQV